LFLRLDFFEEYGTPSETALFSIGAPADERIEVFRGDAGEQVSEARGRDRFVARFLAAGVEAGEDLILDVASLGTPGALRRFGVLAKKSTYLVHHTRRRRLSSMR
jgi:hypothetical protein